MAKIGLVLSGGLAKGAYQIGVLKAINELVNLNSITMISASSVGVLNAYAFINGCLEKAEEIWQGINFDSNAKFAKAFLRGSQIGDYIEQTPINERLKRTALYTTLLNVSGRKIDYINIQKLSPELCRAFVKASVALPPFVRPMQVLENKYFDGALVDNIPISPFLDKDVDCIICIYFEDYNYSFETEALNAKTIKINQCGDKFMKDVFLFRHEYIEKMIKDGYEYGKKVLSAFFKDGELIADYKNKIELYNGVNKEKQWYVTCEVIAKRFNKLTRKLFCDNNAESF